MFQQSVAALSARQVANPGNGELRAGRSGHCGSDPLLANIGEDGTNTFAYKGLGDGTPDAVTRTCYQCGLSRRVEWLVKNGHCLTCLSFPT